MCLFERRQRLALTVAHVLLLGGVGWLAWAYDIAPKPDYGFSFRILGLLSTLCMPVILVCLGQVVRRRGQAIWAWGYSVLLLAVLVVALLGGYVLLNKAVHSLANSASARELALLKPSFQKLIVSKVRVGLSAANSSFLFWLNYSLVMIVASGRRLVRTKSGEARFGKWTGPRMEVALTCLVFGLIATGQLYYYKSKLSLVESSYRTYLYKFRNIR